MGIFSIWPYLVYTPTLQITRFPEFSLWQYAKCCVHTTFGDYTQSVSADC